MVALVIVLCLALPDLVEAESREARTPAGSESATEASDTIPAIVTDRPDVTDAATVVPPGSLLVENGVTFTRDHGNPILDGTESLIRFGVTPRTELRLEVPDYVAALGSRPDASGFGDSSVGFKQQLGPLLGQVELAVIAGVSLPTGARGVSSGGYDPFVKLPWSLELGRSWSIGGMLSFFWLTEAGRRNATGQPTFYIERQLTKPWDVFIEYAADYPTSGWAYRAPRLISSSASATLSGSTISSTRRLAGCAESDGYYVPFCSHDDGFVEHGAVGPGALVFP
jgi:hypothetical protein